MAKEVGAKKVYFWNSLGGLLNAMLSVYIMMIITRFIGMYEAGIFSLGYANALLLQHVGSFDSRSFQCSTMEDKYHFYDFFSFRLCTCLLMSIITVFWVNVNDYSLEKTCITILLSLFCVFSNVSDIFQGNAQKNNRLDLAGKSLAFRIIINLVVFTIVVILKRNIYYAVGSMVISSIVWIVVYDHRILSMGHKVCFTIRIYQFKGLFFNTFPLFLSLFLQMFIYNMPKYAIDLYMPVESQAVYSILFMPASVVNLFTTFIFKPIIVSLAIKWSQKKYSEVFKSCLKRVGVVFLMILFIAIVGGILGTQVLSVFYGTDVTDYRIELIIILIGGGFAGTVTLLYYMITIVGKQYIMLGAYTITFFITYMTNYLLVKTYGMMGASLGYLLTSIVACTLLFTIFLYTYIKMIKKE